MFLILMLLFLDQAAAAKGQLTEAQLSGGTFSISNIGNHLCYILY